MKKPTNLFGTAFCCDPVSGESEKYGETIWYSDCFLIYIDKMGTTHQIRENDDVYDNRIGFYQLNMLYQRSAEIFHKYFKENFKFFGFSDTVLAAIPSEKDSKISPQIIAQTAICLFFELTKLNFPVRIYISSGNLGYVIFKGLIPESAGVVCPVYGSSLLDAYKCDEKTSDLKIKCLGVFCHESSYLDIKTLKIRKSGNEIKELGLIDFEYYLKPSDLKAFIELMQSHTIVQTLDELQDITFDRKYAPGEAIHQIISDVKPDMKEEMLAVIRSGNEQKIENQKFISPYYTGLVEAIEKKELIINP